MKKRLISPFLIVFTLLTFSLKAQDAPKVTVGFSVGPVIPMGRFAETNLDQKNLGYAKVGTAMNLFTNYRINKILGVVAKYSYYRNAFNSEKYLKDFSAGKPGNYSVTADPWRQNFYLGGITLNTTDEWAGLETRFLIGVCRGVSPRILEETVNSAYEYSLTPIVRATSLAMNFGVGTKLRLAEKIQLSLDLDYNYAAPSFDGVKTDNGYGKPTFRSYRQKMATLTLSGGLCYTLVK